MRQDERARAVLGRQADKLLARVYLEGNSPGVRGQSFAGLTKQPAMRFQGTQAQRSGQRYFRGEGVKKWPKS